VPRLKVFLAWDSAVDPGVIVYHALLTVRVTSVREKMNVGEKALFMTCAQKRWVERWG
jgi:hypothetical protein